MKTILKTLLLLGIFPLLAGLALIFDGKSGDFLAGVVLVTPFPLLAFLLYTLIQNDIRRFVSEVNACGTPKYQLYRNNSGIAVTSVVSQK